MGPLLRQAAHLLQKLSHPDRERLPKQASHGKGVGCYFEITEHPTKEVFP